MTRNKSDRKLLEAEWHLSSLLLLPAWSVNQSLAFFLSFFSSVPFLPSAEVSSEESRP